MPAPSVTPTGASATEAQERPKSADWPTPDEFASVVKRHSAMVLGVCRRMLGKSADAEDAFQAVFLVLLRKGATIKQPQLLGNWLYGVAIHTARAARTAIQKRRAKENMVASKHDGILQNV